MPSAYNTWVNWDITAITQDAFDNSNNVEVLMKFNTETSDPKSTIYFYSKNYTTNESLRPKLTVTYDIVASNTTNFFQLF